MQNRMTREQQIKFLEEAPARMEARVRSYLRVPMIRDAARKPAPGQDEAVVDAEFTSERVTIVCCD